MLLHLRVPNSLQGVASAKDSNFTLNPNVLSVFLASENRESILY